MELAALSLEPGERLSGSELSTRFDRGMTGRGIEICYDDDDQRYLRLFSSDTGPYGDDVTGGEFTYVGEGRTGDQTLTGGNKFLARAKRHPLPIFFFHRESGEADWEYQGQVEVVDYACGPFEGDDRDVYRFVLRRRHETRERVDDEEAAADLAPAGRTETTRSRIIRNTTLAAELKARYSHTCQVCGERRRRGVHDGYAEAHHLKPLGRPHDGPDVKANLLVLCPDHHADFFFFNDTATTEIYTIAHAYERELDGASLSVREDHDLDAAFLDYHNRTIASF